jgi:hypothetical protein
VEGVHLHDCLLDFSVLTGILLLFFHSSGKSEKTSSDPPEDPGYPYRPGIEVRLSNGSITTNGYAAVHPAEFRHWEYGPENVLGENIDRTDWENWRVNYYGM